MAKLWLSSIFLLWSARNFCRNDNNIHSNNDIENKESFSSLTSSSSSKKSLLASSSSNQLLGASSSPVIGILTQPIKGTNQTMIAASYVKWLEAGGARSIPIPWDANETLVKDIFGQINGILFPGGGSPVPPAAKVLWNLLKDDDMIPVWGTCLGFEFLVQLAAMEEAQNPSGDILEDGYDSYNTSLPLYNVVPYHLYKDPSLYQAVQIYNLTMNNHHQGISPERFLQHKSLTRYWKITSTNTDRLGKKSFVSTMEPNDPESFPVYGVQFHPEKNAFEYATYPHTNIPYEAIDHSQEGIAMSLYMASFFVDLVRNYNNTRHHDYTKPDRYPLVYSYPMTRGIKFEQVFVIPPANETTYFQ